MTFGEDSRPLDRDAPDEASALKARKACSGYPPVSGPTYWAPDDPKTHRMLIKLPSQLPEAEDEMRPPG